MRRTADDIILDDGTSVREKYFPGTDSINPIPTGFSTEYEYYLCGSSDDGALVSSKDGGTVMYPHEIKREYHPEDGDLIVLTMTGGKGAIIFDIITSEEVTRYTGCSGCDIWTKPYPNPAIVGINTKTYDTDFLFDTITRKLVTPDGCRGYDSFGDYRYFYVLDATTSAGFIYDTKTHDTASCGNIRLYGEIFRAESISHENDWFFFYIMTEGKRYGVIYSKGKLRVIKSRFLSEQEWFPQEVRRDDAIIIRNEYYPHLLNVITIGGKVLYKEWFDIKYIDPMTKGKLFGRSFEERILSFKDHMIFADIKYRSLGFPPFVQVAGDIADVSDEDGIVRMVWHVFTKDKDGKCAAYIDDLREHELVKIGTGLYDDIQFAHMPSQLPVTTATIGDTRYIVLYDGEIPFTNIVDTGRVSNCILYTDENGDGMWRMIDLEFPYVNDKHHSKFPKDIVDLYNTYSRYIVLKRSDGRFATLDANQMKLVKYKGVVAWFDHVEFVGSDASEIRAEVDGEKLTIDLK